MKLGPDASWCRGQAYGLCYGLGGHMEKVANQVYLLTPTNVEVSAEERRRLHERGYDS